MKDKCSAKSSLYLTTFLLPHDFSKHWKETGCPFLHHAKLFIHQIGWAYKLGFSKQLKKWIPSPPSPPPRAMPPPPMVSPLLNEWQRQHPRWFLRCVHQNLSLTYFLSSFFTLPCTLKPVWQIASFRVPVNLFLEVWSWHLLLYDWHLCLGVHHATWCTRVKKLIGAHSSSPSFSFLLLSPLSSYPHSLNSV